jgi:NAD(P)H dehydrogenase (quinone)
LDVTGPEVITYRNLAQITSEISGRPVSYISVTADQMVNILVGVGLPPVVAEAYVSFDTATAQGLLGVTTNVVARLTGIAPQSVRDYLLAHQEALLPQPA